jgi:predicted O-methyltransferase YrrM
MPVTTLGPTQERELAIGVTRLREHMVNHAELIFRRILAVAPGHADTQRFLGIALYKLGRRDEGVALLRAAADLQPEGSEAWADLAAALQGVGDVSAAQEAYGRATRGLVTALPELAFSTERAVHEFKAIDYSYRSSVRYGAGRPPHRQLAELIGSGRERYEAFLAQMGEIQDDFARLPLGGAPDAPEPFWLNPWFPPLDGMVLTQMLRSTNPARFVEIGSGVSTKFARRAVSLYALRTKLISIDPQPRNEIDALCDQVLREPLEDCAVEMFETLEAGDILFLDSSHRSFQGSDVTVFFLDILPRLKPGVIVQIHDIYLPDDYISGHVARLWNEQYLLATALLFGQARFEILFPCWYVGQDPKLLAQANGRLRKDALDNLNLYGASFWMRTT